jgi:hypothetical protein
MSDNTSDTTERLDQYQQGYSDACAAAAHQVARLRATLTEILRLEQDSSLHWEETLLEIRREAQKALG